MTNIVSRFGNNNSYLLNREQLNNINFKGEQEEKVKQKRKDIFAEMPVRALGYTNELGEAIRPLSSLGANLSWIPAIAYIGADVADKYRQDEYGEQNPSAKRASKQLATQLLASVFLPTAAVKIGQGIVSNAASLSKKGLTLDHKEIISDKILGSMNAGEHKAFLDAEGKVNKELYKTALSGKVDEIVKHNKTHKKFLKPFYSFVDYVKKPFIKAPKVEKVKNYVGETVDRLIDTRQQLLDGIKPKDMSSKNFNKFIEVVKDMPIEEKQSVAFEAVRKMEKSRMFNNRILKSIGGLAALSIMARPIDKFVEHIIIGKVVGPAIDSVGAKSKKADGAKSMQA